VLIVVFSAFRLSFKQYLYCKAAPVMKKLVCLLLIVVVFAECKKKSSDPGTSSGTANSYHPLTVGSNWTYTDAPGGTYTLTVTNKDTAAGVPARTYKVLSNNNGGNVYEAQEGNDNYRYSTFNGVLPNGAAELYLKDNLSVNATWNVLVPITYMGLPLTVTLKYTVKETGITKVVQTKSYSNVTHVRLDASTSVFGVAQSLGGGDFFYAKGVGRIYHDLNLGNAGLGVTPFAQVSELVSYQIK
jgi:hypothetical protein